MKIGLAQVNTTIGDFAGNAASLIQAYRHCVESGAELVLAPELVISGYPPRDLVFRSGFVEGNLAGLEQVAAEVGEVPLLAGYIDFSEAEAGAPFLNAAALLRRGQREARFVKCLLPTYDVFDEARYFQPAGEVGRFVLGEKRIGVTICEDVWTEAYLPSKLYVADPPAALAEKGVDLIVNLSASPFHTGKPRQRETMLGEIAVKLGVPLVYCNAVGGHDQLIFDGHSVAIGASGEPLERLSGFAEAVRVVDLEVEAAAPIEIERDPAEEVFKALSLGVRDYLRKCGFRSAVLGLSGGIDSALTAAVAVDALGAENVTGITMPTQYSSGGSVDDSHALAEKLGMNCQELPIQGPFESLKATLAPLFEGRPEDVTEENIQSRIRGLLLMAVANKLGHLLLTTGNKSELAVGYCTIYGDMCGGLAVISDLPKTMVYRVARWLNREEEIIPWNTLEKPPSAELRPDQKDEDSLPPYDVLDAILEAYVEQARSRDEIIAEGFEAETVGWVTRQVDINEWKRQQAAPGIRVTTKAFGMGRRIPIAQRFRS